ncbi:MAG TPA: hypothetical protein VF297_12570 [Pyrinomonadaceae bacterium]
MLSQHRPLQRRGAARAVRATGLCLSLLLLLSMTACGEKEVATVSTESDAIEIISVLRENGFEAEKKEVTQGETKKWGVVLDEGLFGEGEIGVALQLLHDHGLPRPEEPPIEGGSFIPSEAAQRLQEQRRVRADIERQLRGLPGVTSALVTVVLPPSDQIYRLQPQPATASVLVIHKDANPRFNEQQVQTMVSRGVPDLKPENVSVTMAQQTPRPLPARELSGRRRGNILLAVGTGFVIVLLFLLAVLLLRARRQRAEVAWLRAESDAALEGEESVGTADALPGADGSLDAGKSEAVTRNRAGAPALPPPASS